MYAPRFGIARELMPHPDFGRAGTFPATPYWWICTARMPWLSWPGNWPRRISVFRSWKRDHQCAIGCVAREWISNLAELIVSARSRMPSTPSKCKPQSKISMHQPISPMSNQSAKSSKRVLDPVVRVSEVLFGLIMVLTFTGSLSVAQAGRDDIRTMLIGALGCNIAWAIIDGVLYLMASLADRNRDLRAVRHVRNAADPQKAQHLIADALPSVFASVLQPAELETIPPASESTAGARAGPARQKRLVGRPGSFSHRVRVHVSSCGPVHLHAQRWTGSACLQCYCNCYAVLDRLRLRPLDRMASLDHGRNHGYCRICSGRHHHGAGRIKRMKSCGFFFG